MLAARERQAHRLAGTAVAGNAQMDPAQVRRFVPLDADARAVLADAYERDFVSARGHDRILRVARTVADLAGRERVDAHDVLTAIQFRQLRPRPRWRHDRGRTDPARRRGPDWPCTACLRRSWLSAHCRGASSTRDTRARAASRSCWRWRTPP